ncbi:MAG: protein-methionine-sulfoxide reductase heme-binding subunit MsrQ [Gammaproteobacteria bacterium]|nr:protein-methionine-sulfoxide reductase heme-binding subunit MsrQ [Gammaproteobacteria bacterium]
MSIDAKLDSNLIKLPLLLIFLLPLAIAIWDFYRDPLNINPVEDITHTTGVWALRLLLITLVISPARKLLRANGLIHLRRLFGVLCFFYVTCHFVIYIFLDQWFDWFAIVDDIKERPYITVGFAAFVLLIPLALTSTNSMQRKLQIAWNKLHKLVYVVSILAILHFWWLVKADLLEPIIYASILAVLLGYRVFTHITSR